jgi:hypothetical protein
LSTAIGLPAVVAGEAVVVVLFVVVVELLLFVLLPVFAFLLHPLMNMAVNATASISQTFFFVKIVFMVRPFIKGLLKLL